MHKQIPPIPQTPPISRSSMTFHKSIPPTKSDYHRPWLITLILRRVLFFFLTTFSATTGGYLMFAILAPDGITRMEKVIVCFYTFLISWIALNFWSVTLGFLSKIFPKNRWVTQVPTNRNSQIDTSIRTAIIMPIHNEDASRICAGIQTIYESLDQTGNLKNFDFYILSDSTESSKIKEEHQEWNKLCNNVLGADRIFYRHRKNRIHKKKWQRQ